MAKCNPHVWDCQNWLPIIRDTDPAAYPEMTCRNCGRKLAARDTTPNQRGSIAQAIATRMYDGDEYAEVYDSVIEYFNIHLKGGE